MADHESQWRYWSNVSHETLASQVRRADICAPISHDDITYQSIANAFDLKLVEHKEAFRKMTVLSKPHASQPNFSWTEPSPALEAKKRMIRLPLDPTRSDADQVLFVDEKLWVPINVVNGNIHILPGVPRLFVQLLDGLKPHLLPRLTDPEGKGVYRILIATPMAESAVATYLGELAARVEPRGIKVGSYPRWDRKRNTVTLVGRDKAFMDRYDSPFCGCIDRRLTR